MSTQLDFNIDGDNAGSDVDILFEKSLQTIPSGGTSIQNLKKNEYHDDSSNKYDNRDFEQPCRASSPTPKNKKIKKLVKDINLSFKNKSKSKHDSKTEESVSKNNIPQENISIFGHVYNFLKEFILLIIIYVILSQGFIKRTIGHYIPQILPSGEQSVSIIGQIIYGSILAFLFGVSKLILKK